MTNQQILKKAIEKANIGGWGTRKTNAEGWILPLANGLELDVVDLGLAKFNTYDIIFSHNFAKAFWGYKETIVVGKGFPHKENISVWQCHLQQMVLEKEPLKYLEKFL